MRKAEEILTEAFEAHGLPELATMYRAGHYHEDHRCAISAVKQAQREAIEEAAKLAEHNQDGGSGEWDSASLAIAEAIRALLSYKK